jgi:hypothetical protein
MIKLCIISILLSFQLSANSEVNCKGAFKKLGDGSGNDHIPVQCINEIKNKSDKNLVQEYQDSEIHFAFKAVKNAFIWEDKNSGDIYITSGESTLLKDIKKIIYDSAKKELYVWDRAENAILVFNIQIPGNVAPLRVIKVAELINALDFELSADNVHILLDNKDIIEISKSGNYLYKNEADRKLEILNRSAQAPHVNCLENTSGSVMAKKV